MSHLKDYHGNLYNNDATRGNPSLDKLHETEHFLDGNNKAQQIYIYNRKMKKFCIGELKN
jgi:hypothetical protein